MTHEEEGPDDLDLMIEESERRWPGFRREVERGVALLSVGGVTSAQRRANRRRIIQRYRRETP